MGLGYWAGQRSGGDSLPGFVPFLIVLHDVFLNEGREAVRGVINFDVIVKVR
jgi:hypothetical protein